MDGAIITEPAPGGDISRLRVLSPARLARVLRLRDAGGDAALQDLRQRPEPLLRHLLDQGALPDAVRFLAHALPGRETVWWGCMCVTATGGAAAPAAERDAIAAAEAWVWQPAEPGRAEAAIAASQRCASLPGAWPGLAIAWNRSLGGVDAGFGRGIEGAVFRAARRGLDAAALASPGAASALEAARLRRFIASGIAISRGATGRIAPEPGTPQDAGGPAGSMP